jgi:hypothetical protein
LRKQQKQQREDNEKIQALREAELENRRIRALAQNQKQIIYGNSGIAFPLSTASVARAEINTNSSSIISENASEHWHEDGSRNNDSTVKSGSESVSARRGGVVANSHLAESKVDSMSLDELTKRLKEATTGHQSRYSSNSY